MIQYTREQGSAWDNAQWDVSSWGQGAFVNVPLYEVINISRTIKNLKNNDFWIVGIENTKDAELWNNIDYSGKTVIVLGSEGKGIRKNIVNKISKVSFICTF